MKAERIRKAGIGNAPPAGSVALVSLISPFALLAAHSNQPASFGNIDNRLKELAKRLNLQRGIVPSLMGA